MQYNSTDTYFNIRLYLKYSTCINIHVFAIYFLHVHMPKFTILIKEDSKLHKIPSTFFPRLPSFSSFGLSSSSFSLLQKQLLHQDIGLPILLMQDYVLFKCKVYYKNLHTQSCFIDYFLTFNNVHFLQNYTAQHYFWVLLYKYHNLYV